MKIPKVTAIDYLTAFTDGDESNQPQTRRQRRLANHKDALRLLAEFKECWQAHLGDLFEVPTDNQIFKWFQIAKWDFLLLTASIEDLRCRAKHGTDPHNPYGHCLWHFTSALVRRMRGKYGMPPEKAAA
jgi:hypothetical protein